MIGVLENLDKIFSYKREAESGKLYADIYSDTELLNPFTTLDINIFLNGEKIYNFTTIFKCDIWGSCRFCFTPDLKKIYIEKGRNRLYIRANWKNILTYKGIPIFEDSYYEEGIFRNGELILIKNNHVLIKIIKDSLFAEEDASMHIVEIKFETAKYYVKRFKVIS